MLASEGVVALGHPVDELVGVGEPRGLADLVLGGPGLPVGDALPDRAPEQDRVLEDKPYVAT